MRYDFKKTEAKWRKVWEKEGIYEPALKKAGKRKPFYNLMMFPYPSAEGLHIGGVRTFTGVDIYGRFRRMQGRDVFQPIGLDGFGIHSENYALKVGKHPLEHAADSEKNFYRQLGMIGNGFAWRERLETYDPGYYKWTQWIFTEMFRRGLAYRKKQPVNWCPSCKTVLADEQVIGGECERCGSREVKKDLEQWFFKITAYADRLLRNLDGLDWAEVIKTAQRNWIGKSEGAELDFPVAGKWNFVLLHGFQGSPRANFFPWLKKELESRGYPVTVPELPNSKDPSEAEQVGYVLANAKFDANTVIVGHSLGAAMAMKVLEKLKKPVAGLVTAGGFARADFIDHPRPFAETFRWKFDFKRIRRNAGFIKILSARNDYAVPQSEGKLLRDKLGGELRETAARAEHFCGKQEPDILDAALPRIRVFTTRPDTLFGATYMVLAPEHPLIQNLEYRIQNLAEVKRYIAEAKKKTDEERITEGKEKTGVELKGLRAVNPVTGKDMPVWVADYVLSGYGTGAIMAVPGHDERDLEFAKKFKLPVVKVVVPVLHRRMLDARGRASGAEEVLAVQSECWEGEGELVNSGRFSGLHSDKAKRAIVKEAGGRQKNQYRLRDWLLSRQRYWGPPIPMVRCEACAKAGKGDRRDMPGWYAVPVKDLPGKLPKIKDFRPKGTGLAPLAAHREFYEAKCPGCGGKARRETDVSDTFLDSAWYYLRYPSVGSSQAPWDPAVNKKWLPVHSYIGGAEHAVLHLLYSRFLAMALKDAGHLHFEEPFTRFRAHGLITKDGAKMSKSKGNVVAPDEYFRKYGADVMRMYLAFLAPLEQGGDFRDEGISGITRFLERVRDFGRSFRSGAKANGKVERALHRTIKKMTEDLDALKFNTATSALMVLLREMEEAGPNGVTASQWDRFLRLLAPQAPFLTEELWQARFSKDKFRSIHLAEWPEADAAMLRSETFTLIVQVNGRVRADMEVPAGISEKEATELALGNERIRQFLDNKTPRRIVYVPGRLLNIVI